jgi:EAL and modified HD-GYP domain-containing signal transduction protein
LATDVGIAECAKSIAAEPGDGVRYVTRQPILDLRSKVHAYELLFSTGPGSAPAGDRETAARTMLDSTVLFGLEKLTCGLPGFVKCTAEMLTGSLVEMLPAAMTVLEIVDAANAPPELVEACRNLKAAGYRLALDQSNWDPRVKPLAKLADYLKVDFMRTNPRERQTLRGQVGDTTASLVAEKVETQEQFRAARDEGFALVQGYYFCRPVVLGSRQVPANRLSQLEILRLLKDDSLNLHKLTQLVKRDASLTYRLLRLINSPVCAMPQEVHSVQAALLAVGEETFRRMATVAITSEMNTGQTPELLRMAFVRGRFCELAAGPSGLDATEQYLLGLLSLLPAMLRAPMKDLAPTMPLREEIRRALMGEEVGERCLLHWLECYELGDWAGCGEIAGALSLDENGLLCSYQEAVAWTEAALYFA